MPAHQKSSKLILGFELFLLSKSKWESDILINSSSFYV